MGWFLYNSVWYIVFKVVWWIENENLLFFCYPFSTSNNSFSKLREFLKWRYYILNFIVCKVYSKSKRSLSCFPTIPFIVGYSTFSWCQGNFLRFFFLFLDSLASVYIFFKWCTPMVVSGWLSLVVLCLLVLRDTNPWSLPSHHPISPRNPWPVTNQDRN